MLVGCSNPDKRGLPIPPRNTKSVGCNATLGAAKQGQLYEKQGSGPRFGAGSGDIFRGTPNGAALVALDSAAATGLAAIVRPG
jgi:hypothetical protein